MATFWWVIYDIVLGIAGFWSLGRTLTRNEKFSLALLIVVGLGIAVYSGYSDYEDSQRVAYLEQKVSQLSNGQAFNTGQLNVIGRMNGKTLEMLAGKTSVDPSAGPDAVASAAARKIDDLAAELGDLKRQMKGLEWPAISPASKAKLQAVFGKVAPLSISVMCNESDCRTLAENIRDVAKAISQESRILSDTVVGAASGIILYGPEEKRDACNEIADAIRDAVQFPVIVQTERVPASNQPPHFNLVIGRKPRVEDVIVGQGPNPPTAGSFRQGDIWRNSQATPGGIFGWIYACPDPAQCSWKPYGSISL